ncbi:hypothetical protein GCM10011506_40430 [Marivirga lumbricoides]|uniref:Uncharacterized protein n=1 Tax=Marivirga lumbricoides TaxID=1046115 RepID=A0ABQ1N0J9_9BACT|nr:hypothetical protein GCM10011506_40430 [Marivirga lumbricoides]
MGEDSTAQYPIPCDAFEPEFEPHYRDTLITDEAILEKIDKEISSLERIESNEKVEDQDIRIKLVRDYTSGNKDTLCLGSFFGTVLNGEVMKDDKELLQTVKRIIYNRE